MYNWIECSKGKLNYTRNNPRKGGEVYKRDLDSWDRLYDEFVVEFDHNKEALKIKKHRHNIAKLQLQYIENPQKYTFNKTLIRIEEANIEQIELGMRSGLSINEANVYVSKFMEARGAINFKTISVFDYYTILKEYGKANRKGNDSK